MSKYGDEFTRGKSLHPPKHKIYPIKQKEDEMGDDFQVDHFYTTDDEREGYCVVSNKEATEIAVLYKFRESENSRTKVEEPREEEMAYVEEHLENVSWDMEDRYFEGLETVYDEDVEETDPDLDDSNDDGLNEGIY